MCVGPSLLVRLQHGGFMEESSIDTQLLGLVGALYEANLHPEQLASAVAKLCAAVGATAGLMFDLQLPDGGCLSSTSAGIPPDSARRYLERFAAPDQNPWLRAALALPCERWLDEEMLPGADDLGETAFWRELVAPLGLQRLLATVLHVAGAQVTLLSVHRPASQPPFGPKERTLLDQLLPHVRRAAEVRALLRGVLADRTAALEALDTLPAAVVLFDEAGREQFGNRAARDLLARADGLLQDQGVLRCADAQETRALQQAIARAAGTGARHHDGDEDGVSISRPSGRKPLRVLVAPLHGAHLSELTHRCRAMAVITDPEHGPGTDLRMLQRLWGLTATEAQVASGLASGESLAEVAERLGVSHNTARTHLARVLDKTGAHRQQELVRLFAGLPTRAHPTE